MARIQDSRSLELCPGMLNPESEPSKNHGNSKKAQISNQAHHNVHDKVHTTMVRPLNPKPQTLKP